MDSRVAKSEARERLLAEIGAHGLVHGDFTLASGRRASYYVDLRRVLLRPPGFAACGELAAVYANRLGVKAVGGMTMGADPIACGAIASEAGAGLTAFFVRKSRKEHGMQRWLEGPDLDEGTPVLVVEDVVTSGGSTIEAIERVRAHGLVVGGVWCVLDRLAGGEEAIARVLGDAPYSRLFTIDDVYPDRPDRPGEV